MKWELGGVKIVTVSACVFCPADRQKLRIEQLEKEIANNNLETAQHCIKLVNRINELEMETK